MAIDRHYTLGRSGLRVSRLALGTVTFGTEWGWGADKDAARTLVSLGATRRAQLEETMAALDTDLPPALLGRLDTVSAPPLRFPYTMFTPEIQRSLHGGASVRDKPVGYRPAVVVPGRAQRGSKG
jgi:aryl-alcohol dehydrogenase-like predicted oxidoreductase